jgi:nucleoside-diphosphate-sugar epimerase
MARMKRVVITGATGFVGANLAGQMLADGHEVHLLLRPGHKRWRIEPIREHVRMHVVALQDEEGLANALSLVEPDWVFHLAAYGAYPTETDFREMVSTNVLGTANLVRASLRAGFESFVNAGSSSEYGLKDHAPLETDRLEPNSDYAVTKAAATHLCSRLGRSEDANITTLRLYSAYGPWEEPSRLIPNLAIQGLEGRLPNLASPSIARDFVYVDDVVDAFVLTAEDPRPESGAVLNVGTGVETSLREIVSVAREVLNIDAAPAWDSMEPRAWDTETWVANPGRIRERLGWHPKYSLKQGFERFINWLREDAAVLSLYRDKVVP